MAPLGVEFCTERGKPPCGRVEKTAVIRLALPLD